ncbi:MAG: hypothetical protein P8100_01935 [bacterium]
MRHLSILAIILLTLHTAGYTQPKVYATGGPEVIFSLAEIDNNGYKGGNILRFAPFMNVQVFGNADFGKHFGLIFGGAIRNVGFIYNYPDSVSKFKYRSYNLGIPVGLKVGNMNGFLLYGGYEIEFPFSFKQKEFYDNTKIKNVEWFTSRLPSYYQSFFVGVQFPYGFSLKFKYYFSEFFNQEYRTSEGDQPYQGLQANIFYFSLNFSIFRNNKMYHQEYRKSKDTEYY